MLLPTLGMVGLALLVFFLIFNPIGAGPKEKCNNGKDDDGDGFFDCFDSDCFGDPVCISCTPTEPGQELTCDDGLDNDCDLLIDAADPDCVVSDGGGNALARMDLCDPSDPCNSTDMLRADWSVPCSNGEVWNLFASVIHGVLPPDPDCVDAGMTQIDISGGGRLIGRCVSGLKAEVPLDAVLRSFTVQYQGWVDLNDANGTDCPNRDVELYSDFPKHLIPGQDINDTDDCVDNLLLAVGMDRLFKKNATRQSVEFQIQWPDPTSDYFRGGGRLIYVQPLYIVDQTKTTVFLTTKNPDTGEEDAAEVEVWYDGILQGKAQIPFTAYFERIYP